jgi:2-dehydro-3-deoxyphosphogluconate aldolase/(4S)-4-hydroxy-2-oxoglutarate aldolase
MRLEVINKLLEIGLIPLFYNDNVDTSVELVGACVHGGAKVIEFTNRGEQAYSVFTEIVKHFAKNDPSVIIGAGSILDAPTAALFLTAGANFIVGPNFNPEISRLCNKRKVLYLPGCATETEISTAEEFGAEICKVFPGETVGGPAFIKSVMAPCPWHRLMPTGGVDATESSIAEWIEAGAAAVGMGSKLISVQMVKDKKYNDIAEMTRRSVGWVQAARGVSLFMGIEHIGLYARKSSPEALNAWYKDMFGMNSDEGSSAFFLSGSGTGRIEISKESIDAPAHVALHVSNFESAVEVLRSKGVGIKQPVIKPDSKVAYLDVSDPEGNLIHLLWKL